MMNYTPPGMGIPPVLAAALSGALPSAQPQGMQSAGSLASQVAGQNSSPFMATPPNPAQQQQSPMGGMGQMGGNPMMAMLAHMKNAPSPAYQPTLNIPGYGQTLGTSIPSFTPQTGVASWLRGLFSGPTG